MVGVSPAWSGTEPAGSEEKADITGIPQRTRWATTLQAPITRVLGTVKY